MITTPRNVVTIENTTTAFGSKVPSRTLILDASSGEIYQSNSQLAETDTIDTGDVSLITNPLNGTHIGTDLDQISTNQLLGESYGIGTTSTGSESNIVGNVDSFLIQSGLNLRIDGTTSGTLPAGVTLGKGIKIEGDPEYGDTNDLGDQAMLLVPQGENELWLRSTTMGPDGWLTWARFWNNQNSTKSDSTDNASSADLATSTAVKTLADRTITGVSGLTGGGSLQDSREIALGTPSTLTVATTNDASGSTHTHVLDLSGRSVTSGIGLTGGGNLGSDQEIALGTPSTLTVSTINDASGSTHTHVLDLSGRTISPGNGIVGGGDLGFDRTITLGTPSTLTVSSINESTAQSHTHVLDLSGRTVTSGVGLTGGGNLGVDQEIAMGTPSTLTVSTLNDSSGTTHTHVLDLSGRTITAGDGLNGGGDLGSNRSFSVDSTVVRTSGDQSIAGVKTFTSDTGIVISNVENTIGYSGTSSVSDGQAHIGRLQSGYLTTYVTDSSAYTAGWGWRSGGTTYDWAMRLSPSGALTLAGGLTATSVTFSGNATFSSDVSIAGNLSVSGTTTQIDSQITTADRVITLNAGETGDGVTNNFSGVEVDRGTLPFYEFGFNETSGYFELGEVNNRQAVATREDTPNSDGVAYWDAGTNKFLTTADPIGTAATKDTGTAAGNVPLNSDLGTAATKDTGTAAGEVPLNSDLGTAATKDTGTAAGEVPLNSDLGTAATSDKQTSPTDTTADALMAVGAFGIGTSAAPNYTEDLNNLLTGGIRRIVDAANRPPWIGSSIATAILTLGEGGGGNRAAQLVLSDNGLRPAVRAKNSSGTWSDWQELYHTGNLTNTAHTWTEDQTVNGTVTATAFSGDGSGLTSVDADTLDGEHGSHYLAWANTTGKPSPTLTLTGDVSGTATFSSLTDASLSVSVSQAANADTLDGQHGAYYQDASNLSSGTLPALRFTDTSHGNRSGGSLHAIATTTTDGFMSSEDKVKVDGIESNATADQSITAGSGLTGGGTGDVTISHDDTSAQTSLTSLTGADVVSAVVIDQFGHVTSLSTRAITLSDLGYTGATDADNYSGWDLLTDGVSRGTISSGNNVNIAGGTNVSVGYSATNNTVTITSTDTDTTYTAGTGINLTGTTFSLSGDSFNSAGSYGSLRAQATTKADVGLSAVTNDLQVKKAGDSMTGDLNMQSNGTKYGGNYEIKHNTTTNSLDFNFVG